MTQHRFVGALLASAVLHAVLLGLTVRGSNQALAPRPAPPIIVVRLLAPASSFGAQPAVKQYASTASSKVASRPAAITKDADKTHQTTRPADVRELNSDELLESKDAANGTDRTLDLSSQAVTLAARRNVPLSLAQAAREQLGKGPSPPATALARKIAAGAISDCLRDSQDGEDKSKSIAIGGLLALPFMAYSAMTGKCK